MKKDSTSSVLSDFKKWHLGPNGLDVRNEYEDNIVSLRYVDYFSSEQVEANARIIAAAPELLEQLKFVVENVTNDGFVPVGVLDDCNIVIAKAERRA